MHASNSLFSGYGLGLRKEHYRDFLETNVPVDFVEVISENFMVAGGQPRHILRQIRERHPVALHGVSMSIGSADGLNRELPAPPEGIGRRDRAAVRLRSPELVADRRLQLARPAADPLYRGSAGHRLRQHRDGAGRARPADAVRESVQLPRLRWRGDDRMGVPRGDVEADRLRTAAGREQHLRERKQPRLRRPRISRRHTRRPRAPDPSRRAQPGPRTADRYPRQPGLRTRSGRCTPTRSRCSDRSRR